jgi:hypothetical protein
MAFGFIVSVKFWIQFNYCFISYTAMFDRFRQKYPQGSITSSLIQIHNDRYIVSVSIKVDGVILATTLAADEQIQVAEAQATAQALQTLSIDEPATWRMPSAVTELSLTQPQPAQISSPLEDMPAAVATVEPSSVVPVMDITQPLDTNDLAVTAEPESHLTSNHKKMAIVQEDAAAATYDVVSDEQLLSVTDMIPLINMELKRLAWSREKGRDCIIELYNKRSSSLLSDQELLGLLRYLQAQTVPD